jgi:Tol biopolymer transport system component
VRGVVWPCLACVLILLVALAEPAAAVPIGSTVLIDRPSGFGPLPFDGTNNSSVARHALSLDGCFVTFASASDSLSAADDNAAINIFRLDRCSAGTPLVLVNTTSTGAPAEAASISVAPTISADGRFVAFTSNARNLSSAATAGTNQVYVKDLQTGTLRLASRATDFGAAASNMSDGIISGDGTKLVFSASGALHAENFDGAANETDLYERDLAADKTYLISVNAANNAAGHGVTGEFDVDYSGGNVAFVSTNRLEPVGDTDGAADAYARVAGTTYLISTAGGGHDSADRVAIGSNGPPAAIVVAFSNGGIWSSSCLLGSCSSPVRMDAAKTGGTNSQDNTMPFFGRTSSNDPPDRVYWLTGSSLDPADTNGARDIYGADFGIGNPDTAIHLMTGGNLTNGIDRGDATDDGALVVFHSASADLPGTGGLIQQVFARAAGQNTNISQPPGEPVRALEAANGFISVKHAVSDDGRFVVFGSGAPGLGGQNAAAQAFIRDVVTGSTTLVSVASGGGPADKNAFGAQIDGAGRRVAFYSPATNLVPGVTDGKPHVYVRDIPSGTTMLVDRTAAGSASGAGASDPALSGDGTKVVFTSASSDLPGSPADGFVHVYEVDLTAGTTTLVDRANGGEPGNKAAVRVDVNGDGNRVAFESTATNLGGGTQTTSDHIYVRDLANGTTTWVSVPQSGDPAQSVTAFEPSISRDGNRVAFRNLSGESFGYGSPGAAAVFVRDLPAGTMTLASTGSLGAATRDSFSPVLSGDGTKVAFGSTAPNLNGAHDGLGETYLRDLSAGTTRLVGLRDGSSSPGRRGSFGASLNPNGSCVVFASQSDDLVSGGYGPDFGHVFLRALSADCPVTTGGGPPPDTIAPVISRLRMTHTRFAVARGRTPRIARVPRGTAFLFRLSENASTRITLQRELPGRLKGRRCVKPRPGLRRKCTRRTRAGTLVRTKTKAGANRVRFTGRVGRKALRPGRYRATLVATDAAGNRSAPRRVKFRVVRVR